MLPASPKKQLTSIEPLKRLYVDQPLNANAESFPQEIKACGTLKGTQRWGSSAGVSRARLLLFRLRLSAAVAGLAPLAPAGGARVTGPFRAGARARTPRRARCVSRSRPVSPATF